MWNSQPLPSLTMYENTHICFFFFRMMAVDTQYCSIQSSTQHQYRECWPQAGKYLHLPSVSIYLFPMMCMKVLDSTRHYVIQTKTVLAALPTRLRLIQTLPVSRRNVGWWLGDCASTQPGVFFENVRQSCDNSSFYEENPTKVIQDIHPGSGERCHVMVEDVLLTRD